MSKGRKIGHINIVAATREEARQRLAAVEAAGEQALRCVAGLVAATAGFAGVFGDIPLVLNLLQHLAAASVGLLG